MEKLKDTLKKGFSSAPKSIVILIIALIGTTVAIQSVKKTIIIAIDGKETKVITFRKTFHDVLEDNNIVLEAKDKATPSVDTPVKKNDRIDIKRAVNVDVVVDGQEIKIKTTEDKAYKMFEAEGITVKDTDRVNPSRDVSIKDGLKIVIIRIESKIVKESIPIDFSTVVKKNDEALKGVTKTLQEGKKGERVITTELVYEDGKEVSRKIIADVVTKQPVQRIQSVGTGVSLNVSRGGKLNIPYKRILKASATAYTSCFACTGKRPGDKGFGKTATGTIAKRNPNGYSTVAVDPRIIPYGTKLYIEGYGYAVAEDTGGDIKGSKIDVYFNTYEECIQWGRRSLNIYILK